MNAYLSTLNEEQHYVVYAEDRNILCLAGAGTGKTRCMLARISRLIEDGVDPSSILALTFTNAAAVEMQTRFASLGYDHSPEFKTFHSFCYGLLLTDKLVCLKCGYNVTPNVATEEDEKFIRTQVSMQLGFKKSSMSSKDAIIFKKAMKRTMRSKNLITYDEMCESVCQLFVDDDASIRRYKKKYQYIFVDEFQDTDSTQFRFVSSFDRSNSFAVADVLQAIYAFRGADSSITKQLCLDSKWKVYKLSTNYRSTKEICEYANTLSSSYSDDSYRIELSSNRTGDSVEEIHYTNEFDAFKSMIKNCNNETEDCAILVRTNKEVENIKYYLKEHNMKFRTKQISDIEPVHLLQSAYDDNYAITYLSSLLDYSQYTSYIKKIHESEVTGKSYSLFNFIEDFGWNRDVESSMKTITKLRSVISQGDNSINKICDILGIEKIQLNSDDCNVLEAIKNNLLTSKKSSNLYVGTIHSVKGLEFDNVYVFGVRGLSFPITSEENKNLLYVAITRAKNKLHVYVDDRGYKGDVKDV